MYLKYWHNVWEKFVYIGEWRLGNRSVLNYLNKFCFGSTISINEFYRVLLMQFVM